MITFLRVEDIWIRVQDIEDIFGCGRIFDFLDFVSEKFQDETKNL